MSQSLEIGSDYFRIKQFYVLKKILLKGLRVDSMNMTVFCKLLLKQAGENKEIMMSQVKKLMNVNGIESTLLNKILRALEEEEVTVIDDTLDAEVAGFVDDSVKMYIQEIIKYPLLNREEEYKVAVRAVSGDKEAIQLLINSNLRLVVSIAKRYIGGGIPLLDLIQEGNIGLMKAVEMFDPEKGYKFSTYATWWIKQAITRSICNSSRLIRLPVHAFELSRKINNFKKEYVQNHGDVPDKETVCKALHVSSVTYDNLMTFNTDVVSLSTPVGEDDESSLEEFIPDNKKSVEDELDLNNLRSDLMESMKDVLKKREYEVLYYRYGLDGGGPRTLEDVGRLFGVTRERIRQIEAKAERRLRYSRRSKHLKEYLTN